jgi:hypothetical protein
LNEFFKQKSEKKSSGRYLESLSFFKKKVKKSQVVRKYLESLSLLKKNLKKVGKVSEKS